MQRDSKGRFCKEYDTRRKTEYQQKIADAVKLLLDCITKEKIDTACFSYVIDYTGYKNGYGYMLDDNTYNDLKTLYSIIK